MSSQLKPSLLLAAAALIVMEVLWLSQQFDALSLAALPGWRGHFGQLGNIAKLCVVIGFTTGLILHTRFTEIWLSLQNTVTVRRFMSVLPLQLGAFVSLLYCTRILFTDADASAQLPAPVFILWVVCCFTSFVLWLLMCCSAKWWYQFCQVHGWPLLIGVGVGALVWGLALYTRELWGPMSELTFVLSTALLYAINSDALVVNIDDKILGLGDFVVNIAPACSGYEGVGLVTAFTAIYLWLHRSQLSFPRVLWLFPIAALAIWLLNIVRICVLIMIGYSGSPEVAVGGFHSQAGWLTFILTSLGILWLAGESQYFSKASPPPARTTSSEPSEATNNLSSPAVAMLVPLMVLLATSIITTSFSAHFDWWYPLRVVAVALALLWAWPQLRLRPFRLNPLTPFAALVVALLWGVLLGASDTSNLAFKAALENAPAWQSNSWLLLRFIGTAITVPLAEELAFRGYLLCKFSGQNPTTKGPVPLAVVGLVGSSLAFGALHGAWLAGTIAGLIYALLRLRTQHIGDAMVAHALTNALLFGYALFFNQWHLL